MRHVGNSRALACWWLVFAAAISRSISLHENGTCRRDPARKMGCGAFTRSLNTNLWFRCAGDKVESVKYDGRQWHDPRVKCPDDETVFYECPGTGCPDANSTDMACHDGYGGPLCDVCDKGYTKQMRRCVHCSKIGPKPHIIMLFVSFFLGVAYFLWRYRRYAPTRVSVWLP